MCGIAGIVGGGVVDPRRIEAMIAAIEHRGPDDSGTYFGRNATLGHRRLSIIDLAGGHQPISNRSESVWLVFNGEIYNYKELRSDLQKLGRRFLTNSDSEVIVQLYEQYGESCVDHLRGMFSFVIWDREKKCVFAARDHLGQKPLFYSTNGRQILFGSEIKALLAADASLSELDAEALDQYLCLRVIASPLTMFRRIRKLPPGHCLKFTLDGDLQIRRYWDIAYEPKTEGSDEDLIDRLEDEIIESLRHHMVSDVPVGAFLSGGLDSTLLVAILMKHVTRDPINTFSFGLPYKQFDEAPYARMVAEKYGTTHHESIVTPSISTTLPKLVWHLDEPSDPLSVCTYLISQVASQHVKVVIGGDGGDELFGGYDRYYGNRYAGMYAKVPKSIRKGLIGPLLKALPDGNWYKSKAHQVKWLHTLSFLDGSARYVASLNYFYFSSDQRASLYGPAMTERLHNADCALAIRKPFDNANAENIIDRMLYADTQVRLPDHPVMIVDRMTMAHSLESRSPFMDHKLAEFAARLPVRMKVRGRKLRYIQHQLAARYLPADVLNRPKQGFSSALPYMLKAEYEQLYDTMLTKSELAKDQLLCQKAINRLVQEHRSGKIDHGNRLWLLINSEVWYRMFIGGQSVSDLQVQTTN